MKYYTYQPDNWVGAGEIYICDHPMYNRCTLFRTGERGLAVIQEHFNKNTKARWWGSIEPWLAGEICMSACFTAYLDKNAEEPDERGLYPTVPVRKLMWSLRMKPLRKAYWENYIFDGGKTNE